MKKILSLLLAIALVIALAIPVSARKKPQQTEFYYGFITDCGTEVVGVFDHQLSIEEELFWFDYVCIMLCP